MATNVLDINPLEHLTGDIAKSQFNYESILNGLVNWNNSKDDIITIRLATTSEPWFRDINLHTRYYYSKSAGATFSEKALNPNRFAYNSRYQMVAGVDEEVVLRINARNLGGVNKWTLYEDVALYNQVNEIPDPDYVDYYRIDTQTEFTMNLVKNTYIRYSNGGDVKLCKVIQDVSAGDAIVPGTNIKDAVIPLETNNGVVPQNLENEQFLSYGNVVYVKSANAERDPAKSITKRASGYEPYCDIYPTPPANTDDYDPPVADYGKFVYYRGEFFVYISEMPTTLAPFDEATVERDGSSTVTIRKYNTDYWKSVLLLPTTYDVKGSGTLRFTVPTDINGFVLLNGSTVASDENTEIGVTGSLKLNGGKTKEHSGVDIFYTSNYTEWPSNTPKWVEGTAYQTDVGKNAYSLQTYSAVMVFNHADPSVKQRNIINYDGPDLDQGLCIMLPCEVEVEENGSPVIKKPSDGMTFEFILNIWPNHAYDGREYNDLIINKSQVYVYSIKNWDDYKTDGMGVSTVTPVAKFSMARLTNFYVHDENVGVPDRPVVYKATFIYSETEDRWKTYDYYQFPDHILLSPFGFVDPMSKEAYEVQSAGFPLFQNPFANYDLSPIHVSDTYRNQLQEDPRDQ